MSSFDILTFKKKTSRNAERGQYDIYETEVNVRKQIASALDRDYL